MSDDEVRMDELLSQLREEIIGQLEWGEYPEDTLIRDKIEQLLVTATQARGLSVRERIRLSEDLFNSLRRFDILSEALQNEEITEIMINGYQKIFYEIHGRLQPAPRVFRKEEVLRDLIQRIVSKVNREVNRSHPIADARLEDGSRVHVVLEPVSLDGPVLTIRKFAKQKLDIETMIKIGSISQEAADYLKMLVVARYNILISGGTGSGKTTLLNALSAFIPSGERVITIEDSAELCLMQIPNLVRLETKNASNEGTGALTIRDLIRASLRMRPDRIIVGEVRGEEVVDMLQAMNTGHDGSLSTGHANSAKAMLTRLEVMYLFGMDVPLPAVRAQIATAIDMIIQIGRLRDGSRRVLTISEVLISEDDRLQLNDLFVFRETGEQDGRVCGELIRTKNEQIHTEKLCFAGFRGGSDFSNSL